MQLVHPELAREVVDAFRVATEWPQYAKFAYVESLDLAIVALSRTILDVELLRLIQKHVETRTGAPFRFSDADVFMGVIEFEDDGTILIRTISGPSGKGLSQLVEVEFKTVLTP
jgi:hypothetical protein